MRYVFLFIYVHIVIYNTYSSYIQLLFILVPPPDSTVEANAKKDFVPQIHCYIIWVMTVKGSLNLMQLQKMLCHSIQTQNLNLISTPELKCFGSRRTKLQQQSSQQEELERQRVEIADLQQVSFCPSCCMKSVLICIQYFLFAHVVWQ